MRLLHAADLHLGWRAYERMTRGGLNQRETDVAQTFHRMIARWIELRPDLVLVAGDLFEKSRPTNPAIVLAMTEFTRLTRALPGSLIVLISGNHDQARTTDAGSILPLFAQIGLHVVERQAKRLTFADRELSILCVPDSAPAVLEPDPGSRFNILLLHGGLEDVTAMAARGGRARLTAADLHADRWSYVALGDYHCRRDFGPNCGYSGSMDFTSSNIWGELAEHAKGFVEFDLATGERTFHTLAPARPVLDLPVIDATGLDAAAVNAALAANVAGVRIDGAIVRQVLLSLPVALEHELDHKAIKSYRARAMHYQLDPRRPARGMNGIALRSAMRRLSIEELLAQKLRENATARGVDQGELLDAGLAYLREAEAAESTKVALVDATPLAEQSEAA